MYRNLKLVAAAISATCLLAGCAPTPSSVSEAPPGGNAGPGLPATAGATSVSTTPNSDDGSSGTPSGTPAPIPVEVGLPFVPNVQFAPFYVAQARGYYADEGFDVSFRYGDEAEFVRLVASHELAATVASGEQVILAAAQDIPVRYVMAWYQRNPVAVASLSPLASPEDLVGKTVGLPAPSGASASGFRALLQSAGIAPETVSTEVIGYSQVQALASGQVDAAVVYAVNEPLQLKAQGREVWTLEVADYFNLVSNGLVMAASTTDESPEVAQALVNGTLRGIQATLDDPDAAFDIVLGVVPEAGSDPDTKALQRAVLAESLRFWQPPSGQTVGAIDIGAWNRSREFLAAESTPPLTVPPTTELVDTRFVENYSAGR